MQRGDMPDAVRHLRAGIGESEYLRDRWVLSDGAHATLVVVGEQGDPLECARLLGAATALKQAAGTGRTLREPAAAELSRPKQRGHLTPAEWEAAYREGRALPARDVVHLALRLLDEVAASTALPTADVAAVGPVPSAPSAPPLGPPNPLSERERQVLRLVAQGLASKESGRQLFISPSTVNYHLTSIFNKLGVSSRPQAVAVAAQRGLV